MMFVFLSALWWLHWTCVHAEQSLVWLYRALSLARLGRCGFPLPQTIDCLVQGLPKVLIFNGTCSGSAFINLPGFERQDCLLQQVVWRRFETWMRKRNPSHPSHGHGVFCSKATLYFHTHNSGLLVCLDIGYLSSFSHIFCIILYQTCHFESLRSIALQVIRSPFGSRDCFSHRSAAQPRQPAIACHSLPQPATPLGLPHCGDAELCGLDWDEGDLKDGREQVSLEVGRRNEFCSHFTPIVIIMQNPCFFRCDIWGTCPQVPDRSDRLRHRGVDWNRAREVNQEMCWVWLIWSVLVSSCILQTWIQLKQPTDQFLLFWIQLCVEMIVGKTWSIWDSAFALSFVPLMVWHRLSPFCSLTKNTDMDHASCLPVWQVRDDAQLDGSDLREHPEARHLQCIFLGCKCLDCLAGWSCWLKVASSFSIFHLGWVPPPLHIFGATAQPPAGCCAEAGSYMCAQQFRTVRCCTPSPSFTTPQKLPWLILIAKIHPAWN